MQEKENKEFDLLVRSMLAEAEEKAPSRVWEAVSAQIGAKKAAPAWLRPAWISLACAAALAVAVILSGTFNSVTRPEPELLAEVVDVDDAAAAAPVAEIQQPDDKQAQVQPALKKDRSTYLPARRNPALVPQEEPEQEGGSKAEEPVKEQIPAESKDESVDKSTKPAGRQWYVDPFAEMEREDSRSKGSFEVSSVDVKGLVGTNDGSAVTSGSRMAAFGQKTSSGIIESGESTYAVPISVGLGVRVNFNENWSVGTGVDFSLLSRQFEGSCDEHSGIVNHDIKYIGIPLNLYLNILDSDGIRFYSYVGGEVEKALSNKYSVDDFVLSKKVDGLQWSAAVGMGVQFSLTDNLGLFVDPNLRYYFDCAQPKSIRTQQPLMFTFQAGLRFDL